MSDEIEKNAKALATARRKPLALRPPAKTRLPKDVGGRIDALYAMREARKAFGRQLKEAEAVLAGLVEEETALARLIADELEKLGLDAGRGQTASFAPGASPLVVVEDWDALYAYIKANDAFELLHRRTTVDAFEERWTAKEKIPGVRREEKLTFSLTKVGR